MHYILFLLISLLAGIELKAGFFTQDITFVSESNKCLCGVNFSYEKEYNNHLKAEHKKDNKFICPLITCARTFLKLNETKHHMLLPHNIQDSTSLPIKKTRCGTQEEGFYLFEDGPGTCPCQIAYHDEKDWLSHINQNHRTPQGLFYCPAENCEGSVHPFFDITALKNHIRSAHTQQKPYSCLYCDEFRTTNATSIKVHTAKCKNNSQQPPSSNLPSGAYTMASYTTELDLTSQKFSENELIAVEKPNKYYRLIDGPGQCGCNTPYKNEKEFISHIHSNHKNQDGKYVCGIQDCQHTYKKMFDLKKHIRERHTTEGRYQCTKCNNYTASKYNVTSHAAKCNNTNSFATASAAISYETSCDSPTFQQLMVDLENTLSTNKENAEETSGSFSAVLNYYEPRYIKNNSKRQKL